MGKKNKRILVVITGGSRWTYYEWFLLGFYKLQEAGKIRLRLKVPFLSRLLACPNTEFGHRVIRHFQRRWEKDTYNMTGYVEFPDGIRKSFTIDSADAPYMFNARLLDEVDAYFKIQYPCEINRDAFHLTPDIEIPWVDSAHVDGKGKVLTSRGERKLVENLSRYRHKIYPLMLGPRSLSAGISARALSRGYENYLSARRIDKPKKLMCYFGNALGPRPEAVDVPDYLWEGDVIGYFRDKLSHPNEKRAVVADCIAQHKDCDARVISRAYADSGLGKDESLIIPLAKFCEHVANFQYNFNVSGYCRSIPNRFVESFMVGTGIVTDKLAVKWYKPFDRSEVIETVEMGYLPMNKVDWKTFREDLEKIPESEPKKIISCFEDKWHPVKVAEYILDCIRNGQREQSSNGC